MDDPKNRGKQHVKNKSKYKAYSKIASQVKKGAIQSSKRPVLASNWERYLEPLDRSESKSVGRDYAELTSLPITTGGLFTFTTDFQWDDNTSRADNSPLFSLDMKRLEDNMSTIPFYQRIGIDISKFSKNEILQMEATAKTTADKSNLSEIIHRATTHNEKNIQTVTTKTNVEQSSSHLDSHREDEFSEQLRTIDISSQDIDTIKNSSAEQKELEAWLETVLDD